MIDVVQFEIRYARDAVSACSREGGPLVELVVEAAIVEIRERTAYIVKGPQPIAVPDVRGQSVQSASSALQGAGFAVATKVVPSNQPKDTVIAQTPSAGASEPPGTTITLSVSKGPKTSTVPDVTSQDAALADAAADAVLSDSGGCTSGVALGDTTTTPLRGIATPLWTDDCPNGEAVILLPRSASSLPTPAGQS